MNYTDDIQESAQHKQSKVDYMAMNKQNIKNTRKSERLPFREDILLDGVVKCASVDISKGGLYVSTIQHFEQNSIINITIPSNGKDINVKGEVRYSEQGIGMGIKFIDLSENQNAKINKIIENIKNNSSRFTDKNYHYCNS